jgi:galactokinase
MLNQDVLDTLLARFLDRFGGAPDVTAYAPGRIEVLGNHTDYSEGFVLSAAIDYGTFFAARRRNDDAGTLTAADVDETETFSVSALAPSERHTWANYSLGVAAGLRERGAALRGFDGMFLGNIPLGAGLSSSAALEMSTALALDALFDARLPPLELARIGQDAEHRFAGVRCGLLDQITSLMAKADHLVMTDFRTLEVETLPLGADACFLVCNTHARHALVDGAYNSRRRHCELATEHFAATLNHPVTALRDVSLRDWEDGRDGMDPVVARRALHIVGENDRVLRGRRLLQDGALDDFGKLMFASHQSSIDHFENSCPELDTLVALARNLPGVLGARLSGGGFGGSAVVLVHPRDANVIAHALANAYRTETGTDCDVRAVRASRGAHLA